MRDRRQLLGPGLLFLGSGVTFLGVGLATRYAAFYVLAPALLALGAVMLVRAGRGR